MSQESRENFLKLVDEVALPCSQCFVKHVPHPFFVLAVAALYGEDSALCLPREDLNGRLCNRHSAVGFFCSLTCRLSVVVRLIDALADTPLEAEPTRVFVAALRRS